MMKVKEGPRTWNNEKRYKMFMMDIMKEIVNKIDKLDETLTDIKEDGKFKKSKIEGKDSVLEQVLETISDNTEVTFTGMTTEIEKDDNKKRN